MGYGREGGGLRDKIEAGVDGGGGGGGGGLYGSMGYVVIMVVEEVSYPQSNNEDVMGGQLEN